MKSIGIDVFLLDDGRILSLGGFKRKYPEIINIYSNIEKDSNMNDYIKIESKRITIDPNEQVGGVAEIEELKRKEKRSWQKIGNVKRCCPSRRKYI